jgi:hypothetical protein
MGSEIVFTLSESDGVGKRIFKLISGQLKQPGIVAKLEPE